MVDADGEMCPDEVVFRLALPDIAPHDLGRLWAAGTRDPDMIALVFDHFYGINDVIRYATAGVVTADDARRHLNARISPAAARALHRAGHTTPADQRAWVRDHRPTGPGRRIDAQRYFAAGVLDPDDAAALEAAGVDGAGAINYVDVDIDEPADMIRLAALDVDNADVARYRHLGVDTVDAMVRFASIGVKPGDIDDYRGVEPDVPLDRIKTLAERYVTSGRLAGFRTAGITNDPDLFTLAAAGVTGVFAAQCHHDGTGTVDEIIARWADPHDPIHQIQPSDVVPRYQQSGVTRSRDMTALSAAGYVPFLVNELVLNNHLTVEEVVALADSGVTYGQSAKVLNDPNLGGLQRLRTLARRHLETRQ